MDPLLGMVLDLKKLGTETIRRHFPNSFPGLPHPRVHGNGFIQLDLDGAGTRRLHIWGHPAIPRQSTRSPIHNHTYDIRSQILTGHLVDVDWDVHDDGSRRDPTHEVYEAVPRDGADTELVPLEQRVVADVSRTLLVGGRTRCYTVRAGAFHSTITDGPAVTLMEKTTWTPPGGSVRPRVLLSIGESPDNSFNRNAYDPLVLYGIIEEVLPRWHEYLPSPTQR